MINSTINFPPAFVLQMKNLLGDESEKFFESLQTEPPVSIRINPKKINNYSGEKIPWCKTGFYLDERPVFTLDPLFHAGTYYVQEASSTFPEQVIEQFQLNKNPVRALDLCAAPGGKTTHLLSLLHENSLVVSNEVIRSRIAALTENLVKWGHVNYMISNNDPGDFSSLHNFFDLIICDAPCSGEGLFRKDHNAMNYWSPEHVEFCSSRQKRIISDVWDSLKPGGIFIYCTCTYNEKENEDNIKWFDSQFTMHDAQLKINFNKDVFISDKNRFPSFRFYPHKIKGEGLCISVLKKNPADEKNISRMERTKKTAVLAGQYKQIVSGWIKQSDEFEIIPEDDQIFLTYKSQRSDINFLKSKLKVASAGTPVAQIKGKDVVPLPELAFSIHLNKDAFLKLNLDKGNALRYLKGATDFKTEGADGYYLVMFENIPLGFAKKVGNRFNNLYPKKWYIRMDINLTQSTL